MGNDARLTTPYFFRLTSSRAGQEGSWLSTALTTPAPTAMAEPISPDVVIIGSILIVFGAIALIVISGFFQ